MLNHRVTALVKRRLFQVNDLQFVVLVDCPGCQRIHRVLDEVRKVYCECGEVLLVDRT